MGLPEFYTKLQVQVRSPFPAGRLQLYYCKLLCEAPSRFPGFHTVLRTPYHGGVVQPYKGHWADPTPY